LNDITIGRHTVGSSHPTYFVADVAANHDGDLGRAVELIHLCAEAGADAAKFQNFRAETIVSDYGFRSLGGQQSHQASWKKSVFEVYQDAALPLEWTETLAAECTKAGIDYFTAPYAMDLIAAVAPYVAAWKVGSGDITWHEAIEAMAADGKPVLLATGASELDEVRAAMKVATAHTERIVLMQCNTNYTGSIENFSYVNLRVLETFAREFPGVVLGLSDHTPGHSVVLGAVALGARVVEKHFTDDCTSDGPDHKFSLDPTTWREMVDRTRELELALGDGTKRVEANEQETVVLQRRAVRAARDLPNGSVLAAADLVVLRPCPPDAVPPYGLAELVGRTTARDIHEGDCVRFDDLA
jgi:sialic acid synthase SpsE